MKLQFVILWTYVKNTLKRKKKRKMLRMEILVSFKGNHSRVYARVAAECLLTSPAKKKKKSSVNNENRLKAAFTVLMA